MRTNINPSIVAVTYMIIKLFRDKSGSINYTELQAALTTFGYNLSPPVYSLLIRSVDNQYLLDINGDGDFSVSLTGLRARP